MLLAISIPEALTIVQRLVRKRESLLTVDPFRVVANRCEVHARTVYKWSVGESPVPEERKAQIVDALVDLGMDLPHMLKEASEAAIVAIRAEADGEISAAEFADISDALREVELAAELARLAKLRRAGL